MIDRIFKHPPHKSPTDSPDSQHDSGVGWYTKPQWRSPTRRKLKKPNWSDSARKPQSPDDGQDEDKYSGDEEEWVQVDQAALPKRPNLQIITQGSPMFEGASSQDKVEQYRSQMRELSVQVTDLQDRADYWEGEARRLQKELKRMTRLYEESQQLAQDREMALAGAQAFLDAPEECSEAEAVAEMEELNMKVRKTANFFADALSAMQGAGNAVDPMEVLMRAERGNMWVPPALISAIQDKRRGGRDSLLRVAFETTLVDTCHLFIDRWHPDGALDFWIKQTYEGIRQSEMQSVYGRWRMLTRAQLARAAREKVELPLIFLKSILDRFTDITTAFGQSLDYVNLSSDWIKLMEERTAPIAQSILQVRKVFGEKHTTSDLTSYMTPPGALFDQAHRRLRNRAGETESQEIDRVLCTTALGVVSTAKRLVDGDTSSIEELRSFVALAPEVVLESYLATAKD